MGKVMGIPTAAHPISQMHWSSTEPNTAPAKEMYDTQTNDFMGHEPIVSTLKSYGGGTVNQAERTPEGTTSPPQRESSLGYPVNIHDTSLVHCFSPGSRSISMGPTAVRGLMQPRIAMQTAQQKVANLRGTL